MKFHDRFVRFFASFFYLGYSPLAPGTCGSIGGILLAWFFYRQATFILTLLAVGGFLISKPAREIFNSDDPRQFVLDEVCGMMLTLLGMPRILWLFGAGFVLFRIFDVLKPWPINRIQSMENPASILWDDLAAGFFSNVCLRLILHFTAL